MVIKRSLGMPGRVLNSPYTQRILAAEAAGAPKEEIVALIAGAANARGTDDGDFDSGYVWAGQSVGLIDDIEPAGAIIARMVAEAAAGVARLRVSFG
jgi:NAD(P)H-dependent flavin oxidoreductase YrpB (nitropropane dioxygenase family)